MASRKSRYKYSNNGGCRDENHCQYSGVKSVGLNWRKPTTEGYFRQIGLVMISAPHLMMIKFMWNKIIYISRKWEAGTFYSNLPNFTLNQRKNSPAVRRRVYWIGWWNDRLERNAFCGLWQVAYVRYNYLSWVYVFLLLVCYLHFASNNDLLESSKTVNHQQGDTARAINPTRQPLTFWFPDKWLVGITSYFVFW